MSSTKDYESLLKDYDRAQAQLARTKSREKEAKKALKKAEKNDVPKTEGEISRLEFVIAKSKKKARKASAAIAKIRIKQWIKANAKQEKSYKLTIDESAPEAVIEEPIAEKPAVVVEEPVAVVEEVRIKRKYTRQNQAAKVEETPVVEVEEPAETVVEVEPEPIVEAEPEPEVEPAPVKKERRPRRTSAQVTAEKEAAQAALRENGNDFTIIEGVGPSVTKLLHSVGIKTFQDLAASDYETLKALLKSRRNNIADPTTWVQQAQMVIDNDREGLEKLQNQLKRVRVQ